MEVFLKMSVFSKNVYRDEIERLAKRQSPCPYDGFSCCSICEVCGEKFCECGREESCERMVGNCPVIDGSGSCPKGWNK